MGVRKRISLTFSLALGLIILYYDTTGMFFCFLSASAVHELCHMGAVFALGARLTSFDISPFGGSMSYTPIAGCRCDFLTALAGPFGSIAAAYIASTVGNLTHAPWLYTLSGTSLVLGLFNLLPILPLDGGNALGALLLQKGCTVKAIRILNIISIIFCTILIFLGLYILIISRYNITMLFISVWLSVYNIRTKGWNIYNVQKNP